MLKLPALSIILSFFGWSLVCAKRDSRYSLLISINLLRCFHLTGPPNSVQITLPHKPADVGRPPSLCGNVIALRLSSHLSSTSDPLREAALIRWPPCAKTNGCNEWYW